MLLVKANFMLSYRRICSEDKPEEYLHLYRSCFLDPEWRKAYGTFTPPSLALIHAMAITPYPSVERYIVLREKNPIGFFHLAQLGTPESRRYLLSGGIEPRLKNSGWGIWTCCVGLHVAFRTLSCNKVCCEVLATNQASLRMLYRMGFMLEGTAREHVYDPSTNAHFDMRFLGLLSSEFPNQFAEAILKSLLNEEK